MRTTSQGMVNGPHVGYCVPDICLRRAAWHGARVILRQVSSESTAIFDLIIELYSLCQGNWDSLTSRTGVSPAKMELFLEYAAVFLGNIGNYYVSGYVWLPAGLSVVHFFRDEGIKNSLLASNPTICGNCRVSRQKPQRLSKVSLNLCTPRGQAA